MATRAQLLEQRAALGAAIRASEPWEASYKRDKASFRRLLAEEQALEQDVAEHYHGLAIYRLSKFIRWEDVLPQLHADVTVPGNDPASQEEETLLIEVILPHYEELMQIAMGAGQAAAGIPIDLPALTPLILAEARSATAELVGGVTDTTRNIIKQSIQSGIASGDNLDALTKRVQEAVANPVRAEMIAQTETVNAYQSGYYQYALATGAKTKEWEAKTGACQLCSPLDGKVLPVDQPFVLPNGNEVQRPAAHTRCRCGLIYDY